MPPTGVQANWDAVSFDDVPIIRVNSIRVSQGGSLEAYKGDKDLYASVLANLSNKPQITIQSADIGGLNAFSKGQHGDFTAKHLDALQVTGGAIVWTMTDAAVENVDSDGGHGAFGTGTMTLLGSAPDGITNPLAFTRV